MRTSIPCPKCDGPLRKIAYRRVMAEDPNQNYEPIHGAYYCPKDDAYFKTRIREVKIGTL